MNFDNIYRDSGSVDPSTLKEFEQLFSIKFPSSYRELIQEHNALYPDKNHFKFTNQYHNELWSYRLEEDDADARDVIFYGFGEHLPEYEQIERHQDFDVYGHDSVIAFGSAANGDHICFDYRHDPNTSEPHVVVMFHDALDENRKMAICHVANSFDEFLNMLY